MLKVLELYMLILLCCIPTNFSLKISGTQSNLWWVSQRSKHWCLQEITC